MCNLGTTSHPKLQAGCLSQAGTKTGFMVKVPLTVQFSWVTHDRVFRRVQHLKLENGTEAA